MALASLIVCADAHGATVLDAVLRDLNIRAEQCGDLAEAAVRLSSESFDVVIVDCSDEMAALGLIGGIRKSKQNESVLIVALLDGENNVRGVFAAGCNFVLYKPISAERAADSLRAARGLMRREKRRSKRVRLHGKASIAYASVENASASLLDLSEEGVAIRSEKKLPPKCKVYFQFTLPGEVSLVRLSGEVVWQDDGGRVGLRFADVPQSSRRILNGWLQGMPSIDQPASKITAKLGPLKGQPVEPKGHGLGLLSVSASDRRGKTRHACRISADVFREGSNVPNRCSLSDISAGGCYVDSTAPFPVGTLLNFVVRTEELKLRVQGRVQTVHPGVGMGVEFTLKTPEHQAQIKQLIACAAQSGLSV
jgi:DNA-binding NarL/FixJ family response regulator